MIIAILVVLGLCFGSFVNALVWRLRHQSIAKKSTVHSPKPRTKDYGLRTTDFKDLSIVHGRSMCVECGHTLAAADLVPVVSWILLGGKCRYCHQPISRQYPLVELTTALLFVLSYFTYPLSRDSPWNFENVVLFGFWLVFLIGFMALAVYDLRWYLLPNRIVYPLIGVGLAQMIIHAVLGRDTGVITQSLFGAIVGGGLFYILFQVSAGRWIGGGDVKLGFLLGLVLGSPARSLLMIFLASILGSIITVPLLLSGRAKRSSHIPFGPFLILAAITVQLYGVHIVNWYQSIVLPG